MTTKKLWGIIGAEFISYTGGTAQIISNGECEFRLWENPKDANLFCRKLNEQSETITQLHEENDELKQQLKTRVIVTRQYEEYKAYQRKVKDTLQKHYKLYINMTVELRHDKYSNGVCHDVLEVLEEIAEELGVELK